MITLYAAYNAPFNAKGLARDFRVIWALEELGLPHTFHWMDTGKGEHKVDPNRSINPFGKIPSFTDGEVKLFESAAIVHYLYEKAGKLPSDPLARTRLLQWMFAALNTVEPPFLDILAWNIFWMERPGREVRYPEVIAIAQLRLIELERALGGNSYLVENEFGPADILLTTVLNFAVNEPGLFDQTPIVRAYLGRCRERPAYQRALAAHLKGPDAQAA